MPSRKKSAKQKSLKRDRALVLVSVLILISFFCSALFPDEAIAEEQTALAEPDQNGCVDDCWLSVARFGFSVESQSSTGFKNVGGSTMSFDLLREVGSYLALGLKTLGQGGENHDARFYRMGAGLTVRGRLSESFSLYAAVLKFSESGLDGGSKEPAYRSDGVSSMIGWERMYKLGSRVQFGWGGFFGSYSGDLHLNQSSQAGRPGLPGQSAQSALVSELKGQTANRGISRGIMLTLRTTL